MKMTEQQPSPEAIDDLRRLGTRHMREYIDALAEHGVDLTHFEGSPSAYDVISAYHLAKAQELDRQRSDGVQESQESRPETPEQDGPGYACGGVVTGPPADVRTFADPERVGERYLAGVPGASGIPVRVLDQIADQLGEGRA